MADDSNQRAYRPNDLRPTPAANSANGNDPLAELARLIGQSDPFAESGRDSVRRAAPAPEPASNWAAPPVAPTYKSPPTAPDPRTPTANSYAANAAQPEAPRRRPLARRLTGSRAIALRLPPAAPVSMARLLNRPAIPTQASRPRTTQATPIFRTASLPSTRTFTTMRRRRAAASALSLSQPYSPLPSPAPLAPSAIARCSAPPARTCRRR